MFSGLFRHKFHFSGNFSDSVSSPRNFSFSPESSSASSSSSASASSSAARPSSQQLRCGPSDFFLRAVFSRYRKTWARMATSTITWRLPQMTNCNKGGYLSFPFFFLFHSPTEQSTTSTDMASRKASTRIDRLFNQFLRNV